MAYGESRQRFYEYLDIIKTSWTSERFSYDGEYYSYDDVCLTPKPYQQPHPPFRVAATTTDTFPVLGKLGYPIFRRCPRAWNVPGSQNRSRYTKRLGGKPDTRAR